MVIQLEQLKFSPSIGDKNSLSVEFFDLGVTGQFKTNQNQYLKGPLWNVAEVQLDEKHK